MLGRHGKHNLIVDREANVRSKARLVEPKQPAARHIARRRLNQSVSSGVWPILVDHELSPRRRSNVASALSAIARLLGEALNAFVRFPERVYRPLRVLFTDSKLRMNRLPSATEDHSKVSPLARLPAHAGGVRGDLVKVGAFVERLQHHLITAESGEHSQFLRLVVRGKRDVPFLSNKAAPNAGLPCGKRLRWNACDRHPARPGLERVNARVAIPVCVSSTDKRVHPGLAPFARALSLGNRLGELRNRLVLRLHSSSKNVLVDAFGALFSAAKLSPTMLLESCNDLFVRVDVLDAKFESHVLLPRLRRPETRRELPRLLHVEQVPVVACLGANPLHLVLEFDELPGRWRDLRPERLTESVREDRVHPGVQQVVRVCHRDTGEVLPLSRLESSSLAGSQVLYILRHLLGNVVPSEVFQAVAGSP